MYKVRNISVINIVSQLPEIFKNKHLKNFKVIYWLGRLESELDSLARAYDKMRGDLALARALKDKDGIPITKGNQYVYSDDLEINLSISNEIGRKIIEVLDEEVEITIDKIKLNENDLKYKPIGGDEIYAVSPDDIRLLSPFVEFPEIEGEIKKELEN